MVDSLACEKQPATNEVAHLSGASGCGWGNDVGPLTGGGAPRGASGPGFASADAGGIWGTGLGKTGVGAGIAIGGSTTGCRDWNRAGVVIKRAATAATERVIIIDLQGWPNHESTIPTPVQVDACGRHLFMPRMASSSRQLYGQRAAVKLNRGGGPALNDLIAGQVKFFFANGAAAIGHVQGGAVKAIAHTGRGRRMRGDAKRRALY